MTDNNGSYIALITSEHADKLKFVSYVYAFLNMISPAVDMLTDFDIIFALENAEGDQLDMLGSLVGVSRELPVQVEDIPSILSDDTYRKVIKSKVFINHWDGTREGMEAIMAEIFPNLPYEVIDNQNMEYSVSIVAPDLTDEDKALIENGYILPKPSGVKCTYNILDSGLFGWDSDTTFIKGWDQGTWASN